MGLAYLQLNAQHATIDSHLAEGLDTIHDTRDDKSYEVVLVDSLWWFNQHLSYKTPHSDCFRDQTANCEKYGRLYPYHEALSACPDGWRLPTETEFDQLLTRLATETSYQDSVFLFFAGNWANVNEDNRIGYKFEPTGWKHKKRYSNLDSQHFWLVGKQEGSHAHMYEARNPRSRKYEMLLFRHNHEGHKPIIDKRKFAIRCVRKR